MNLQIISHNFSYVCTLQPETDSSGVVRAFMPQFAYLNQSQVALHAYSEGPFCKFVIPKDLRKNGVYVLSVQGEVKYVGECVDFSSRYNAGYGQISPRNCYRGGQPTNCRINALIFQSVRSGSPVDLWFLETKDYKKTEEEILELLGLQGNFPLWNLKGKPRLTEVA